MSSETIESVTIEMMEYHFPRYNELAAIPLYRDQVLDCLNSYIMPLCTDQSQPPVTAAMINNYVKLKLLPPPVKKKYNRDQQAQLLCILLLKQVFSICEIRQLLEIQTHTHPFPQAYDYFCVEFEAALRATFSTRKFSGVGQQTQHPTPLSELVCSAALCVAQKIFTQKFLHLDQENCIQMELNACVNE